MKHSILLKLIFLFSINIQAQQTLYPNQKSKDTLKMEYRNGLPYAGKIHEHDIVSYYEAGSLVRKDSLDSGSLKSAALYENGKLVRKLYIFFEIFDDPKDIYEGSYIEEKPFDGYFLDENVIENLEDIPVVSFYEKGVLKHKYTTDYFNTIDDFIKIKLDRKATFINDKLVDGFQYNNKNRNMLVGIGYKNGIANSIELNLFGMHYFNRFTLELDGNKLEFKELKSGITIKATYANESIFIEIFDENGKLLQNNKNYFVKEGSPNSLTSYSIENGKLVSVSINANQVNELNEFSTNEIDQLTLMIYSYLLTNSKQNLATIFDILLDEFKRNEFQSYSDLFSSEESIKMFENRIGGIYFDEKGNAYEGILIKELNNQFETKLYLGGKLVETKTINDLIKIRPYFEQTLQGQ